MWSSLNLGDEVILTDVEGGDSRVRHLMELGFTRGTRVRLLARAPFGGPVVVEVRGARLAIRLSDAACLKA
ncbi:MAG: ferrous iron transport protein A [Candidatus Sericytochromatia bacterium]|nr:ferrous iron transport protein A [Candidatus Tanganyikabacteria bacterium]